MAFTHLMILLVALLQNLHVEATSFRDMELDQKLKILNKPYVKSFKIGDADIFDCVNIYQQPALSHPLLKGHKIQMNPSIVPQMEPDKSVYKGQDMEFGNQTQACPLGTVPIRRTSQQELIKAEVLMKGFSGAIPPNTGYHHALVASKDGGSYNGVYGQINVQNPTLADGRQFSEAVMWLDNGVEDARNTIQSGWIVYQALYNDSRTRFVTSWTADAGKTTGCYNTLCPGFVQVHQSMSPGYVFQKMSTYGGVQWEAKFLIFLDQYSGNWWLVMGRTYERIGYWPRAIFTGLQGSGDAVGWGGRVFSPPGEANPPMGSGHFAQEGFKKAAFIHNLQFLDEQYNRILPQWNQLIRYALNPECYTLSPYGSTGLYFGGPGGTCSS